MEIKEDCFHIGVKALIPNSREEVLLLQLNPERHHGKELWDIPGGRIQKKESLEETLKREVYEETGLENIVPIQSFSMSLSNTRISLPNSDVGLVLAVYLCQKVSELTIRLSAEHIRFGWFSFYQAAKLLQTNFPPDLIEKLMRHNT